MGQGSKDTSTKFIDLFKAKDRKQTSRRRLENCPYPKSCCPVSYHVSTTNQAGVCAGLIDKSPNLDCIRHCIFFRDAKSKELKYLEHFMTPDEALETVHSLTLAVRESLDFASSYQKYYKELCKARDDGDNSPSEL